MWGAPLGFSDEWSREKARLSGRGEEEDFPGPLRRFGVPQLCSLWSGEERGDERVQAHKVRHCGGRRGGQDLHAHILHQQHFSHDLRDDKQFFVDHPGAVAITTVQGEELRKVIGAPAYIECSSKTQQNVKAVFDAAIKVVLQPPEQKKKKRKGNKSCYIL